MLSGISCRSQSTSAAYRGYFQTSLIGENMFLIPYVFKHIVNAHRNIVVVEKTKARDFRRTEKYYYHNSTLDSVFISMKSERVFISKKIIYNYVRSGAGRYKMIYQDTDGTIIDSGNFVMNNYRNMSHLSKNSAITDSDTVVSIISLVKNISKSIIIKQEKISYLVNSFEVLNSPIKDRNIDIMYDISPYKWSINISKDNNINKTTGYRRYDIGSTRNYVPMWICYNKYNNKGHLYSKIINIFNWYDNYKTVKLRTSIRTLSNKTHN